MMHIIDQMPLAAECLTFCMDTINHDDSVSFADKAAMVENYKAFFPLWPHNILMMQDALDRINPAYAGLGKWVISKIPFYVKKGVWRDCADNSQLREDVYLHVASQVTYRIEYSVVGNRGLIKINDTVVYAGAIYTKHELNDHAVDILLVKVGSCPF
jgi:hypothetical protein